MNTIKIENLQHKYGSGKEEIQALNGIDLEIKQGETIAKEELEVKKLDSGFAGRIILRVERRDDGFVFKYRYSEEAEYEIFKDKVSVEYLSERKTGEFYGTVIGMYASKEEGSEI